MDLKNIRNENHRHPANKEIRRKLVREGSAWRFALLRRENERNDYSSWRFHNAYCRNSSW
jgi:hypothetical protein